MYYNYQKAVPTFIMRSLKGEPITIYGDGSQGTDHIYVDDAVKATIAVFESSHIPEEALEIGSGEEITVNEIADVILRLTKNPVELQRVSVRRGELENTRIKANLSVLKNDIGFTPQAAFEDGILKTIEYYSSLLHQ